MNTSPASTGCTAAPATMATANHHERRTPGLSPRGAAHSRRGGHTTARKRSTTIVVCDPCRCKLDRYAENCQTFDSRDELDEAVAKTMRAAMRRGKTLHIQDVWTGKNFHVHIVIVTDRTT